MAIFESFLHQESSEDKGWRRLREYVLSGTINNIIEALAQRAQNPDLHSKTIGELIAGRGTVRMFFLDQPEGEKTLADLSKIDCTEDNPNDLATKIASLLADNLEARFPKLKDAENYISDLKTRDDPYRRVINELVNYDSPDAQSRSRRREPGRLDLHIDMRFSTSPFKIAAQFRSAVAILAQKLKQGDEELADISLISGYSPLVAKFATKLEKEGWNLSKDSNGQLIIDDHGFAKMTLSRADFIAKYGQT